MPRIGDLKDFDTFLRGRSSQFRQKLRDMLAGRRLTLAEARRHKVLIPMVGVYTPGWQALPACSWEFIELITKEGVTGTGEWSVRLDRPAIEGLQLLEREPDKNLLDEDLEIPFFMAWWDLVGHVLGKPLHRLWAELFEVGFVPPSEVPLAAYTWQRFPDAAGNDSVTFETWPEFARQQCENGFRTVKVSMTGYEPDDYVDLLGRIRGAVPAGTDIRIDAHGTWNFVEARRILPELADVGISYIEQPINALMPERFYPPDAAQPTTHHQGYQREYYFRKLEELRGHTSIPFSCHWWTPPILQPPGANRMNDSWAFDWPMIERYDPVDISAPDIGLGVFGLWRLLQMTRFLGLHIMMHSNFELGLQSAFRGAMFSALGYYPESAGLYLGTTPRLCLPMDTEYNQVSDDVLVGGKLPIPGSIRLSDRPGHGMRLDPERVERYRYTEEAVRPHREYAISLYDNYMLDRPRRRTMSGWPKAPGPERISRRAYPYDLTNILGIDERQDVDVELNT